MTGPILAAVDGSATSKKAAAFAARRAEQAGVPLFLLYVVEWSPYSVMPPQDLEIQHKAREEQILKAEEEILTPLKQELAGEGLDIEILVRHGHAAQTIVGVIQEKDVAEVVIGRTGHTGWQAVVFGSTANTIAQTAPVPVTIVPPGQ